MASGLFRPGLDGVAASTTTRVRTAAAIALTATAHVAIWDDHDYGPNDADGAYPLKGASLALFKRYWANPSYGLPETPGVFGLAPYGYVDILLLDDQTSALLWLHEVAARDLRFARKPSPQ